MGEAVASLALGVQPDRTAIARFPIASTPGVFDFAGLREVDANVFDVGFTEHVGLKQASHYAGKTKRPVCS